MKRAKSRVFAACLCIIALASGLSAQEQPSNPVAHKFHELKDRSLLYSSCEFKFALNDFREAGLQKAPNARAYIIGYNGRRALSKPFRYYLDRTENWLHFAEGVPKEKIVVIDGGYRDQPVIELWVVPEGAAAPSDVADPCSKEVTLALSGTFSATPNKSLQRSANSVDLNRGPRRLSAPRCSR